MISVQILCCIDVVINLYKIHLNFNIFMKYWTVILILRIFVFSLYDFKKYSQLFTGNLCIINLLQILMDSYLSVC